MTSGLAGYRILQVQPHSKKTLTLKMPSHHAAPIPKTVVLQASLLCAPCGCLLSSVCHRSPGLPARGFCLGHQQQGRGAGRSHHLGHTYRLPSFPAMFLELCHAACDLSEEFLFLKTASLQMLLISVMLLSFVMITPKLKLASGVSCLTI